MSENLGFPQLNVTTYPSQIFWLVVAFAALYMLMSKLALPRVAAVLDMRKSQKDGNLDRAQQLQEEAEKVRTAYEASLATAQAGAGDVLKTAGEDINEKLAAENAKFAEAARKRIVVAEQNIAKAKKDALQSLADISADIAADMVGKIADIQVNKSDAKQAVMTVMQKG